MKTSVGLSPGAIVRVLKQEMAGSYRGRQDRHVNFLNSNSHMCLMLSRAADGCTAMVTVVTMVTLYSYCCQGEGRLFSALSLFPMGSHRHTVYRHGDACRRTTSSTCTLPTASINSELVRDLMTV